MEHPDSALSKFIKQHRGEKWFIKAYWEENQYGPYITVVYDPSLYLSETLITVYYFPIKWLDQQGRICNYDYKYHSLIN